MPTHRLSRTHSSLPLTGTGTDAWQTLSERVVVLEAQVTALIGLVTELMIEVNQLEPKSSKGTV